jgi:replicative DNA helicase
VDRADRSNSFRERGPGSARPANGRIPPHNLQAEESVLGAILLSRDALGAVIEAGLRYDDFYKPGHQHIFDVAVAVSQSGGPVDTITVADELSRLGLLEQAGGVEALHALQNATPAISNAASYAKIVQDAAMLRRLILVAADISEIGYGRPDNVDDALDDAESRVFRVADRRVVDSYRDIGELMKLAVDRIEENFARGDTITGIATGFNDLDELLSGLQPSTLNIVGARPSMGKCCRADTPMIDLVTGAVVTAAEMFDLAASRGGLDVLALDEDGRMHSQAVSVCVDDGIKPVFEVTTRSGRRVGITATHPLLTANGWQPLAAISVGDFIAMPTSLPIFGNDDLLDEEIDSLALNTTESVPAAAFRLPRRRLARYLSRLFASNAKVVLSPGRFVSARQPNGGQVADTNARVRFVSVGEQVARDVAHALLRFGIRTRLRERSVKYRDSRRRSFEVEIIDAPSMLKFCDEIGILGKQDAVDRVRAVAAKARSGYSLDTVPCEVWDDIEKAKGELSWAEVNRRCGRSARHNVHRSRRGPLRRETVAELAEALDDDQLRWWASPDIRWDRVVSIEPAGRTRVIDFTVPEVHNFVAADLFLHNTAMGLGMATHVAKHSGRPVLVFSLEMGHVELTQRILSSEAEVDSQKIRNGRLSEADWAKIGRAIGRLEVPLFLDDNPRVTVMEIRAKARRLKMQHGDLGMILVDYLQLMSGGGNAENRQLEVSEISRNLKILARELEVPIVALSQLSRNLESRSDKRPMLSDLRESGSLEQDADVVIFLYRDEVYNKESPDRGAADVIVAKHRAGPTGSMRLVFRGQYARFDNAAPRGMA